MNLVYWTAARLDDARCYSIRAKTRKAVVAELRDMGCGVDASGDWVAPWGGRFDQPKKVLVEYSDAFDLLKQCLAEGGLD